MSAENGKIHTTASKATINHPMPLNVKREPGTLPPSYLANGALGPKLASLKPARDLTLGGRGGVNANANKKVFTPNLNVERKKNTNVKTSKDTTRGARGGRGGRGGERGGRGGARGGRGGSSTLIQTTGVFSEGAGAINIRRAATSGGGSYGRSADDSVSAMRKPILVKNELKKIDLKAEAAQMHELLGDSDDEDYELPDDKTDLAQVPIKLNETKWKYIKTDIKVEPNVCNGNASVSLNADDASTLAVAQKMQSLAVQQQQKQLQQQQEQIQSSVIRYPQSVEELLQATQPQIFLMQLPDTLPCEDDEPDDNVKSEKTADTEMPTTSNAAATLQSPTSQTRQRKTHTLKNLEEGQVGKLLRYKSGKIKLVLGETYFDIDMGMETGFLQDLMSISANREERSGNMINLGPIQAKLTATPDWEQLLKQQQQQQV